jgi:hypothetical protein
MAARSVAAVLLVCGLCMGTVVQAGVEPTAAPLEFLRVYAPADQLERWPLGGVHYLPIKPEEFQRLWKAAQAGGGGYAGSAGAAIASAEYRARFQGEELSDGQAALEIRHVAEGPVLLSLDPFRLPVSRAVWAGDPPQRAVLGTDGEGNLQLLVARSGRLELEWSLRGRREPSGAIAFGLELPPCPVNRLLLELPSGAEAVVDGGGDVRRDRRDDRTAAWQIEAGGHRRVLLHVVPADAASRRRPPVLRESAVYDFSLHGVDVSAQWQLDVGGEPLRQLAISLDPGLELREARYGDVPLRWSVAARGKAPAAPGRVILEFPEAVLGKGRPVRLAAMAPLVLGEPWTLPRVRAEGTFWQEGTASLLVGFPLVVDQLVPVKARQAKVAPLAPPRSGESLETQYFGADSSIRLVLSRAPAPLAVDTATSLELGRGEIAGKVAVLLRTSAGERFDFSADVAPPWLVEGVQSTPADAVEDWTVQQRDSRAGTLRVRLAKAVSPKRALRLVLAVRRPAPLADRPLGGDDLAPLRFRADGQAGGGGRDWMSLRAAEPFRLRWMGADRLRRWKPGDAGSPPADLFLDAPPDTAFENDGGAAEMRVVLESPRPNYSADIRVEAAAERGGLTESYWVRCVPEGAPVERLLLRFSTRRGVAPHWTGPSGDRAAWAARLLPGPAAETAEAAAGETWEIAWKRPQREPFELRASRTTPLAGEQPISLAALPEAASQRGALVVRSPGPAAPQIHNRRLKPGAPPFVADGLCQMAEAVYTYDPARELDTPFEPAVTLSAGAEGAAPAWVWHAQLESRYQYDGSGHHAAIYRLESAGQQQLRLLVPAGIDRFQEIWGDDGPADWTRSSEEGRSYVLIDLPAGRRFPVVSLHFTTAGERLGLRRWLSPPFPRPQSPCLLGQWTVWLPAGYRASDPDLRWQTPYGPAASWSERVFGPLGRAPRQSPFSPLGGLWRAPAWAAVGMPEVVRAAKGLLQQWGRDEGRPAADGAAGPKAPGWGALVTGKKIDAILGRGEEAAPTALLVDRTALARLPLAPLTPVRPQPGDTALSRGMALLERAGLVLLAHPQAIVITSAAQAAAWRQAYLAPSDNEVLWAVKPGPLADQIGAAGGETDPALVPSGVWAKSPAGPQLPWLGLPPGEPATGDSPGWTAYRLDLSGPGPVALCAVRPAAMASFRWIAFLAVLALGWWKRDVSWRLWAALGGLSICAAATLPEVYAAIASGAVLGLGGVAGLWLALGRGKPASAEIPEAPVPLTSGTSKRYSTVGTMILAASTAIAGGAAVRGGEPAPAVRTVSPARVFIPVDDKQQPTGDQLFVPEDFYSELQRRAGKGSDSPRGWLLCGATYRGSLSWEAGTGRLAVGGLQASFDVEVLGHPGSFRLPLGDGASSVAEKGVQLDSRAVPYQWRNGAVELTNPPEPGQYRLDVALQPSALSGSPGAGFTLRIPRLASARLELAVPPNAPAIEVASATGGVVPGGQSSRLVVELGPIDRLAVRWPEGRPEGPRQRGLGGAASVEELDWLRILPGSVALEVRLKIKAGPEPLGQLLLWTDPRLRLLPPPRGDSLVARVQETPGVWPLLRAELARPISDQATVDFSFLVTDASGVGNLRMPRLALADFPSAKRWIAVSADPVLQCSLQGAGRVTALSITSFTSAWGPAPAVPLLALEDSPAEQDWYLSVRPVPPRTSAGQTLSVCLADSQAILRLDARLATAGAALQHRVAAPKTMAVDRVSIVEAGKPRTLRWSRDADGGVTIFLSAPVSGDYALVLDGRIPLPGGRDWSLPLVRLRDVQSRSYQVQLFREPSICAAIAEVQGLSENGAPAVEPSPWPAARSLKCFSADVVSSEDSGQPAAGGTQPAAGSTQPAAAGGQRAAGGRQPGVALAQPVPARVPTAQPVPEGVCLRLRLTPNRPKVRFDQITSLRPAGGQWEAQVDLRLHVGQGLLDELRLEVPAAWAGPLRVTPPAAIRVNPVIAPAGRREVVIRPKTAIDGEYRVSLAGPMSFAAGQRIEAPQITPAGIDPGRRWLVLPTQSATQSIGWETNGLQDAPLPADFLPAPMGPESLVTYRVEGEIYRAVAELLERPGAAGQVSLADICLAWSADGTARGVVAFDLDPAGTPACVLRLPAGLGPLRVTAGGIPVAASALEPGRWRVPLGFGGLPQRIEVVFSGTLQDPPGPGTVQFTPPALEGLPVRQTLWNVVGPPLYQAEGPLSASAADRLQQVLVRLQSSTALLETGAEAAGKAVEDIERWSRWSMRRCGGLRSEMEQLLCFARSDLVEGLTGELESLERRRQQAARRLGGPAAATAELVDRPVADQPVQLWQVSLDRPEMAAAFLVSGGRPIAIQYRPIQSDRLWVGLATLAALLALFCLAALWLRSGVRRAVWERWPEGALLAAGLAWWLLLEPSLAGLAVAGLAGLGLLRRAWFPVRPGRTTLVPFSEDGSRSGNLRGRG